MLLKKGEKKSVCYITFFMSFFFFVAAVEITGNQVKSYNVSRIGARGNSL